MSDEYVVEMWGALNGPSTNGFIKDGRDRSEPMSLDAARRYRNQMALWHKKPNGTEMPGRFPLEPKILKVNYEEIP